MAAISFRFVDAAENNGSHTFSQECNVFTVTLTVVTCFSLIQLNLEPDPSSYSQIYNIDSHRPCKRNTPIILPYNSPTTFSTRARKIQKNSSYAGVHRRRLSGVWSLGNGSSKVARNWPPRKYDR